MPIVIRHDANPSLAGAFAFLAGQGKRAEQQQQQDFENNLRLAQLQQQWDLSQQQDDRQRQLADSDNQLRRDLANQQVALQRDENNRRRSMARAAAGMAFLDRQQRSVEAIAAQSARDQAAEIENARRQQELMLEQQAQMERAQQQQDLTQMRSDMEQRNKLMQGFAGVVDPQWLAQSQFLTKVNQQALAAPDQYELERIRKGIQEGNPEAIREGLNRGILQFSPEQATRIRQIHEAMAQLDLDPNLSPSQKAMAQRKLAEELNAIRPIEVSPENQPTSIQQQFSQEVPVFTDPVTGEKFMATRNRNGVWEPFELPHIRDKNERQQQEQKRQADEDKAARDARNEDWKIDNQIWFDQKPDRKDFIDPITGQEVDDMKAFQVAYNAWLARRPQRSTQPAPQPVSPQEDMGLGELPQPSSQPLTQQPSSSAFLPVSNRQELESLPPGTKFILPDGRTGTRQ